MKPETAIVQQAEDTEQQLIDHIKNMDSQTAWSVGAMISRLKTDHGLTDEQIAAKTELSREIVTQRRLVWDTFSDCYSSYKLSWTHFREALNWDDAPECLQWADELQASVAEMKAWRRSQHGEDLTQVADEDDEEHNSQSEPERDTRFDIEEPPPKATSSEQPSNVAQEQKPATPRRDELSPIAKVFDTLEHSIQQLRDYQELVSIREKANHLAAMVTEKIQQIDEEG